MIEDADDMKAISHDARVGKVQPGQRAVVGGRSELSLEAYFQKLEGKTEVRV